MSCQVKAFFRTAGRLFTIFSYNHIRYVTT